jgi:hypothetical protein
MNKLQKILDYIYNRDINITDNDFQDQCNKYINDINNECDTIYNNYNGINIDKISIVPIKKQTTNVTEKKGMSIMELMKRKQNQEIEDMINEQLVSQSD